MTFLHRKSVVYHEDVYQEDFEPQRRRRLSKPLTNSSSTNSASQVVQQASKKKGLDEAADETLGILSPAKSREALRTFLFSSTSDLDVNKPRQKRSTVALMTSMFENRTGQASTSQLSLASPGLTQRPYSQLLSDKQVSDIHKPSLSNMGREDRFGADLGNVSPLSSQENIVQNPAPPSRRTASFTPGMATRAPSATQEKVEERSEPVTELASAVVLRYSGKKASQVDIPPSRQASLQNDRCATPSDLEVPNIGRLGSLRVVNGNASPAPSEMSKRGRPLWAPAERRDTSSVYVESKIGTIKSRRTVASDWEDEPLPTFADEDEKKRPEVHRIFSFTPGSEAQFNGLGQLPSDELAECPKTPDRTKLMAEDYISGLPTSPFESLSSTSPESRGNVDEIGSPSTPVARTGGAEDSAAFSQVDAFTSSPSEGSVRIYRENADSRRSFIDETLGLTPSPDRSPSRSSGRINNRPESPVSFFSVLDSENSVEDQFESAIELPTSRSRSVSPLKQPSLSPLKATIRPEKPERMNTKSDSGYSSNTSLSTLQPLSVLGNVGSDASTQKEEKRRFKLPFRKAAQKSGKAVLVKPNPNDKLLEPSTAQVQSASALTSTTSFSASTQVAPSETSTRQLASSPQPKERQRKKLQKIRRKSAAEVAGELVVPNLQSVDCLNIPPVSTTTRETLAQRSQALPELERTYNTQEHTAKDANGSTLSLDVHTQDVRFPSPKPREEERVGRAQSRPGTRKRSLSRPRTWFGWGNKDDKEQLKSQSQGNELRLRELGAVVDMLGDNPYDMAQSKPRDHTPPSAWNNRPDYSKQQMTPSNVTTNTPRPKPTMDAQTASNMSKLRRRSQAERTSWSSVRQAFDDRGGVPGKMPHSARASLDAPPLPALTTRDEMTRRFSYRNGYATHPCPLPYGNQQSSDPISVEDNEAPAPPPHSPRPAYVDDHGVDEFGPLEEEASFSSSHFGAPSFVDDEGIYKHAIDDEAPPPPCHSPRPMDVTHEHRRSRPRYLSWGNEVSEWQQQWEPGSAVLRRSWHQVEQHYHPGPATLPGGIQGFYPSSEKRRNLAKRAPQQGSLQQHQNSNCYQQNGYFAQGLHVNHGGEDYPHYDIHSVHYDTVTAWSDSQQYNAPASYTTNDQPYSSHEDCYYPHRDENSFPHQKNASHGSQFSKNHYHNYAIFPKIPQHSHTSDETHTWEYAIANPHAHAPSLPRALPRPTSRHSHLSQTSHMSRRSHKSLAEELHPELSSSSPRPPSALSGTSNPQIGRYSGGLEYNYDRYSRGFDGSAGTRSVSTAKGNDIKRDGKKRSSWIDMQSYGIDLGDVPTMQVPVGATGDRMVYQ